MEDVDSSMMDSADGYLLRCVDNSTIRKPILEKGFLDHDLIDAPNLTAADEEITFS